MLRCFLAGRGETRPFLKFRRAQGLKSGLPGALRGGSDALPKVKVN
jgi:hypothetical protein